ncbi:MAG: hypothetical protein AB8C95_03895 [Phycisphaeraceae bacterium]
MRTSCVILCVLSVLMLSGCSAQPISKTWGHLKQGYNTTKQVYRATKSVAKLVNPLEYVYVSEHGESMRADGEPFVTHEAMIGFTPSHAE